MGRRVKATRAVIYMRQSTYREESISLELQETACRAHAEREGYAVVAVEADPGITGRTWDRPAVQRVMGMVERGEVDVIILWKWSRLSRSRKDWAVAADTVEKAGGRIESATEAIDTSTSTGRLARGVMVEFAAFESERIGDVWREAHARRIAEGKPANGKPRFGYSYDRDAKLHVPDPVAGPILAEAYRRYIDGESFYSLNLWIQSTGVPPAAGYGRQQGIWSARTLRRMLDSGFGAGKLLVKGEHRDGIHEPVITETEWARYQRRREDRQQRPRTERSQHLLSGLVRCGTCGASMSHSTRPERESGPQVRCKLAIESRTHPHGVALARYPEAAVRTWLQETAPAHGTHIDVAPPTPAVDQVPILEREREKTYGALTRLAMRLAEETISEEIHQRAAAQYQTRLEQLDAELADARARLGAPAPSPAKARQLLDDWDYLGTGERRAALAELLERVEVTPGGRGGPTLVRVVPRSGPPQSFRYESR